MIESKSSNMLQGSSTIGAKQVTIDTNPYTNNN